MVLTRIWAIILALLATGCLAGMFLLSVGSGTDFTPAEREAVRAVTEAGVAAIEAQIHASPVQRVTTLVTDNELKPALARSPQDEARLDRRDRSLQSILTNVAEELRVSTGSNMTVAVVDEGGSSLAASGIAEALMGELVGASAYREIPPDRSAAFSVVLGGDLYVATASATIGRGRRLVAIERLNVGAGSLLRRVLGAATPAGLVRGSAVLGDIIGDQPVKQELLALASAHESDAPEVGASKVFSVGTGLDARIGALGRVPGPAGHGQNATMLVVLSRETAAAGKRDLAQALSQALERGIRPINWVLLFGLLIVSATLAVYLPTLEALGPLDRLTKELDAVALGTQHQVFHDRYSGAVGGVARATAVAQEALRQAFLAELEIDDEDVGEDRAASTREHPRSRRHRRLTSAHRRLEDAASTKSSSGSRSSLTAIPAAPTPTERTSAVRSDSRPYERTGSRAGRLPTGPGSAGGRTPSPGPARPARSARARTPSRAYGEGLGFGASGGPASPSAPRPQAASSRDRGSGPPSSSGIPSITPASSTSGRPGQSQPISMRSQPTPGAHGQSPRSDADPDKYREVFEDFLQVKIACGESTAGLTYERFAVKLRKNTSDLQQRRPGVKDVKFTVYVKDGKAALKAKVVK